MSDQRTIATYDQSAQGLAEYFKGIGPRIEDIERGLALAQAGPAARVVEIGCGDGRDAVEIVSRVAFYEGFDPSEGLLKIARERLPNVSFVCADALSYKYPSDLDVMYAFASLLHSPKEDVAAILARVADALKPGGIFYISLKERSEYQSEIKKDAYGERLFYFYTPELMRELADERLAVAYEDKQARADTDWFTIAFQKHK